MKNPQDLSTSHRPRRRRLVLVAAGAVAVSLIAVISWRFHQDQYGGTSVRGWTERAITGDAQANKVLHELGPKAVPSLVHLLQTRESSFYKFLGRRGNWWPQPIQVRITRRLMAPMHARMTGAQGLGILGAQAEAAVPALVQALKDSNDQVGWEAAKALARVGPAAVPELTRVVAGPDVPAQHKAVYALGEIGPEAEAASPALIEALRSGSEYVRSSTAYSLSRIGFPALHALSNIIDHGDGPSRAEAIKILIRFNRGIQTMVPALVNMAQSHSPESRQQALAALGAIRIGDNASIQALGAGLRDPVPEVRLAAAKALSLVSWRAQAAAPALRDATNDQDPSVREWAGKVLAALKTATNSASFQPQP